MVPAPLLRVVEGTTLVVSVRNDLRAPLRVHGLCARDGGACAPLDVPPAERPRGPLREPAAPAPITTGRPPSARRSRSASWAAPSSSIPPACGASPTACFVITEWSDLTPAQLREIMTADDSGAASWPPTRGSAFMINGLSWPATERLHLPARRPGALARRQPQLAVAPDAPARVLLPVERVGDGVRDEPVAGGEGRRVVTQSCPRVAR